MKTIPLSQGKVALVDDFDYQYLSKWKWCARKGRYTWYAYAYTGGGKRARAGVAMHRLILWAKTGQQIDHIDRDGLNNQRSNLRIATASQNQWNKGVCKKNAHGLKGVFYVPTMKTRRWRASIGYQGAKICLGFFPTPEEAAKAYNTAAREKFGQFASLNNV
jgi:hypothetical protein